MSFSYNVASLSSSALFRARLELGDTLDPGVLQDEEINYYLSAHPFNRAVGMCAEACIAKVSQDPARYEDETGVRSEWFASRVSAWEALAKKYLAGETVSPVKPISGAVSGRTSGPTMPRFD